MIKIVQHGEYTPGFSSLKTEVCKTYMQAYFLAFDTIHTINAITPNMRIKAHHIPALKMVPMASQLLRKGMAANNKA
jgi:hypothetical protein